MARAIAIANQKGGVGKTTTAINLAAALVELGARVLLVDLDPQGNASMGSGFDVRAIKASGCEWLLGERSYAEVAVKASAGYVLIPANADLTAAELALKADSQGLLRLKSLLTEVAELHDFVLLDCPPSLSTLTAAALMAADGVLVPMQCEYFALEGLAALLETIARVREVGNPKLELDGLLRTMFDARNNLANQVSNQLLKHFPGRVFGPLIPRSVRLAEAPSHGLPITSYDGSSRAAAAYRQLAQELAKRHLRGAA